MSRIKDSVLKAVQSNAIPIHRIPLPGEKQSPDYDSILKAIGPNTKVVMIGEASHGTDEFYSHRAEITKRLIAEHGFNIVAVEADWPDAYRVNRYVRNIHSENNNNNNLDRSSREALSNFQRFPRWMWRNTVVEDFVEWMNKYNLQQHQEQQQQSGKDVQTKKSKIGFYGLDMYSFQASRNAVLSYLDKVDPDSARRTRSYYACFDQYGVDVSSNYSWAVGLNLSRSCREPCEKALMELLRSGNELLKKDTSDGLCGKRDRLFFAQQNAKVVKDAEDYYRNMLSGSHVTWNIRDTHMCNTLVDLMSFLNTKDGGSVAEPKAVIWAHNSHLGDASQTDAGWEEEEVLEEETGRKRRRKRRIRGGKEVNLGQLIRQKWGMDKTFNIGFSTHTGTVTAAHDWDEEPQTFRVKESLPESWENLLHRAAEGLVQEKPSAGVTPIAVSSGPVAARGVASTTSSSDLTGNDYCLIFRSNDPSSFQVDKNLLQELNSFEPKIQRAIGVCYRPGTERQSHYFAAKLTRQFDAMIHIDVTKGVKPLDKLQAEGGMMDETYPTGL